MVSKRAWAKPIQISNWTQNSSSHLFQQPLIAKEYHISISNRNLSQVLKFWRIWIESTWAKLTTEMSPIWIKIPSLTQMTCSVHPRKLLTHHKPSIATPNHMVPLLILSISVLEGPSITEPSTRLTLASYSRKITAKSSFVTWPCTIQRCPKARRIWLARRLC